MEIRAFIRRARLIVGATAAAIALLGATSPLAAQVSGVSLGVGTGPTLPTGDLAEEADTGFRIQGSVGIEFPLSPIALRADVAYDRLSDSAGHGDFGIVSGVANVIYRLQGIVATPYVLAGAGVFRITEPDAHDPGETGAKLGFNVGTGIDLRLPAFTLFVEGKWQHVATDGGATRILPIVVGIKR